MSSWTVHDVEYARLLEELSVIAAREGFILNPDGERLDKVVGLMTENLVATGRRFCPCKQSHPLDPAVDVVCPCPEWKEEIGSQGNCFCRLFFAR